MARPFSLSISHTSPSPSVSHLAVSFFLPFRVSTAKVCGDDTLREVSLPGRYGRVYILPGDKRLVIKTLRKSEKQVYLEMLPNYYWASLLKRLYGLHVIRPPGGIKVYFAVWASVMPSELCLFKCYDLRAYIEMDLVMLAFWGNFGPESSLCGGIFIPL